MGVGAVEDKETTERRRLLFDMLGLRPPAAQRDERVDGGCSNATGLSRWMVKPMTKGEMPSSIDGLRSSVFMGRASPLSVTRRLLAGFGEPEGGVGLLSDTRRGDDAVEGRACCVRRRDRVKVDVFLYPHRARRPSPRTEREFALSKR